MYLFAAPDTLQTLVKSAHPPLVVCSVCCLLLAESHLVLLVRNEERLLDSSTSRIQ